MIILASSSPRRRELLTTAGIEFEIAVSDVEEVLNPALPPAQAAIDVACQKAREVAKQYPRDCVVGADTIVLLDGAILGKPKDKAQAAEMLGQLSGKTHTVYTGVCVIKDGKENCFAEATQVEFYELTADEIDAYVTSGEPMDKAGAYGIQGLGCLLVKRIEGDFFNVMGFPVARVVRAIRIR